MFNLGDEGVHFERRHCSTSAAWGVQVGRCIQPVAMTGLNYEKHLNIS